MTLVVMVEALRRIQLLTAGEGGVARWMAAVLTGQGHKVGHCLGQLCRGSALGGRDATVLAHFCQLRGQRVRSRTCRDVEP
eukprot:1155148-Pelagomonas_calceolata.AAC.2